jgi:hypothetical protein
MIGIGRPATSALFEAALSYAEVRNWPVAPGAHLVRDDRMSLVCSCGSAGCPSPGAHPGIAQWRLQATTDPATIHEWWTSQPDAPIVIPTGRAFDAIDVPESAGFSALERLDRLELWLGPVLTSGDGRMQFLVMPGAAPDVASFLNGLGWPGVRLDLGCRSDGGFVFAPPSHIGMGRYVRWIREPDDDSLRLPTARALLASIAYACYRRAATA